MESRRSLPLRFICVLLLCVNSANSLCVPRNSSGLYQETTTAKLVLPSTVSLSSPPPETDGGEVDAAETVKAICTKTDYPEACNDTILKPYMPTGGPITARLVVGMLMRACTDQTHAAMAAAGNLLSDPSTPSDTKPYIQVCKDSYSDALDNLQEAAAALNTGDKSTLNIMVSAAMTDYSSCEDSFQEISKDSPLTCFDDALTKLASNCLAISTSFDF